MRSTIRENTSPCSADYRDVGSTAEPSRPGRGYNGRTSAGDHSAGRSHSVSVFPITNTRDLNQRIIFEDLIDDSMVAHTNSIGVFGTAQLPDSACKGIRRYGLNGYDNPSYNLAVQVFQLAESGFLPLNPVGSHFSSGLQLPGCEGR